jgi:hypothetical protein
MMYVFIEKCEDGGELISITEDPVTLFKNGEYNESCGDKLYQLGSEVKIETTIKVTSGPTYRVLEDKVFKHAFGRKAEEGYNG